MMQDIRNGWIQSIVTEAENPNLLRFWFGRQSGARGIETIKIEAANVGEAWELLSKQLTEENHPEKFSICSECNGRGWHYMSRDDCQECAAKGWKAA